MKLRVSHPSPLAVRQHGVRAVRVASVGPGHVGGYKPAKPAGSEPGGSADESAGRATGGRYLKREAGGGAEGPPRVARSAPPPTSANSHASAQRTAPPTASVESMPHAASSEPPSLRQPMQSGPAGGGASDARRMAPSGVLNSRVPVGESPMQAALRGLRASSHNAAESAQRITVLQRLKKAQTVSSDAGLGQQEPQPPVQQQQQQEGTKPLIRRGIDLRALASASDRLKQRKGQGLTPPSTSSSASSTTPGAPRAAGASGEKAPEKPPLSSVQPGLGSVSSRSNTSAPPLEPQLPGASSPAGPGASPPAGPEETPLVASSKSKVTRPSKSGAPADKSLFSLSKDPAEETEKAKARTAAADKWKESLYGRSDAKAGRPRFAAAGPSTASTSGASAAPKQTRSAPGVSAAPPPRTTSAASTAPPAPAPAWPRPLTPTPPHAAASSAPPPGVRVKPSARVQPAPSTASASSSSAPNPKLSPVFGPPPPPKSADSATADSKWWFSSRPDSAPPSPPQQGSSPSAVSRTEWGAAQAGGSVMGAALQSPAPQQSQGRQPTLAALQENQDKKREREPAATATSGAAASTTVAAAAAAAAAAPTTAAATTAAAVAAAAIPTTSAAASPTTAAAAPEAAAPTTSAAAAAPTTSAAAAPKAAAPTTSAAASPKAAVAAPTTAAAASSKAAAVAGKARVSVDGTRKQPVYSVQEVTPEILDLVEDEFELGASSYWRGLADESDDLDEHPAGEVLQAFIRDLMDEDADDEDDEEDAGGEEEGVEIDDDVAPISTQTTQTTQNDSTQSSSTQHNITQNSNTQSSTQSSSVGSSEESGSFERSSHGGSGSASSTDLVESPLPDAGELASSPVEQEAAAVINFAAAAAALVELPAGPSLMKLSGAQLAAMAAEIVNNQVSKTGSAYITHLDDDDKPDTVLSPDWLTNFVEACPRSKLQGLRAGDYQVMLELAAMQPEIFTPPAPWVLVLLAEGKGTLQDLSPTELKYILVCVTGLELKVDQSWYSAMFEAARGCIQRATALEDVSSLIEICMVQVQGPPAGWIPQVEVLLIQCCSQQSSGFSSLEAVASIVPSFIRTRPIQQYAAVNALEVLIAKLLTPDALANSVQEGAEKLRASFLKLQNEGSAVDSFNATAGKSDEAIEQEARAAVLTATALLLYSMDIIGLCTSQTQALSAYRAAYKGELALLEGVALANFTIMAIEFYGSADPVALLPEVMLHCEAAMHTIDDLALVDLIIQLEESGLSARDPWRAAFFNAQQAHLQSMDFPSLASGVVTVVKMGWAPPADWVAAISTRARLYESELDGPEAADLLSILGFEESDAARQLFSILGGSSFFSCFERVLIRDISDLPHDVLASAANALVRMQCPPSPKFWKAVWQTTFSTVSDFSPRELSNLLEMITDEDSVPPAKWMERVQKASLNNLATWREAGNEEPMATLLEAAGRLSEVSQNWLTRFVSGAVLPAIHEGRVQGTTALKLVFGAAMAKYTPDAATLQKLVVGCQSGLSQVPVEELSSVISALAMLHKARPWHRSNNPLLDQVCQLCMNELDTFKVASLIELAGGFRQFKYNPGQKFVTAHMEAANQKEDVCSEQETQALEELYDWFQAQDKYHPV